ncbi:MAG: hypothetical protein ACK4S6_20375 [Roseateles asaccharophilus]|uniref:Uncharacterized protein n=1 Tax=Roseateles asaccharophilus TaxID=582607 RepID=A0A4R6MSW1_9BURK|nr:hypothetical protein [Roseateles asaccharophilus]MDN3546587.1 hypothetical protein [Roseateles asaccharophilus]TDP04991.1 hypothetical protein DFR39_11223 [Roseateles asaccharophilus]
MKVKNTLAALAAALCLAIAPAQAQDSRLLAPGFSQLAKSAEVVVMPVDVELFSMSAGGVNEPRADWTASAHGHMKQALQDKARKLGIKFKQMDEQSADAFAEQVSLHAAVARSIALHHSVGGAWALPTKDGKLDWSFGDAMQALKQQSGSQYGLFVWVRDSYASAERKMAMVGMAILGIGLTGGSQVGYASLVDLGSGQVVWFNRLARASGDLRDAVSAAESIEALMTGFPKQQ